MSNEPFDPESPAPPGSWDALARYIAGESPPAEAAAVRAWIEADPDRERRIAELDRSLNRLRFEPPPDLDVEAALRRVSARLDEAEPVRLPVHRRARLPAAALWIAAAIGVVAAGSALWLATRDAGAPSTSPPATAARTITTGVGETDTLELPDGSRVLLAPGSRLAVAAGYGAPRRELELDGEALFDVRHDAAGAFIVRAGAAQVEDLGTTFAIRGYAGEEVRVAVTSGSVRLSAAAAPAGSGEVLRAGEGGVLRASGGVERITVADADLAWTHGRLTFQDAPLSRVRADLRRWFGVELVIDDASLAGRHLTATFEDESVDEILAVIRLALGAELERRGDTVVVRPGQAAPVPR